MYTALKNLAKDMMLEPERPLFGGQIVQKDYIEYYKYTINILLGALGSSRSLENLECHVSLISLCPTSPWKIPEASSSWK